MAALTYTDRTERRSIRKETAHHYFIPSSHNAYRILQFAFVALPIMAGLDKFFNILVDWTVYLSPIATNITGVTPHQFMLGVGVVEIIAGLIVAFNPRVGGIVVAVWLWGIIGNLFSIPDFYDVAARDFGLSLGALALSKLSVEFRNYRRNRLNA